MKIVKIGIVGCGGIFKYAHLPAYKQMKNVKIVAICDIVEEKMDDSDFPVGVKKYKDWKDLLNDPEVDAVDICAPNYLHSIVGVEALKKGIHVFTEKPDAISVAEMQRLMDAEKESGKVYMAMRNNRHLNISKFYKKYIEEGKAGELYCGRCGIIRRRGIPGKGGWFTTKAQSGGGPLVDLGVHMIDLAIYFMGNPKAVAVSGCIYNKFANSDLSDSVNSKFGEKKDDGVFDVEDLAMGFIRFENGACLQIEFSWASNIEKETAFLELRGEKSGIKFSYTPEENRIYTEECGQLVNIEPKIVEPDGGHGQNLVHFIDVIQGNAKPDFTSEQGMNQIKILQAIYESAKLGKEIIL
ncbi:MAG: Gfo/Idh/MocA family oxidoreductase [Clostridia bacterium]|nr:Gfo/Idh/MocA family oxidoreductase [Clostridia bacterium]